MNIILHEHIKIRLIERGVTEEEVRLTVLTGESYPVQFGRIAFRRNFSFESIWKGRYFNTKQVEVFAVQEGDSWIGITVIARYF